MNNKFTLPKLDRKTLNNIGLLISAGGMLLQAVGKIIDSKKEAIDMDEAAVKAVRKVMAERSK